MLSEAKLETSQKGALKDTLLLSRAASAACTPQPGDLAPTHSIGHSSSAAPQGGCEGTAPHALDKDCHTWLGHCPVLPSSCKFFSVSLDNLCLFISIPLTIT